MELMLDMQKTFKEKLEALREENGEIKARLDGRKNNSKKERMSKRSEEGEKSQQKSLEDKDQSTRGTHQKTKEPKKTKDNEVFDTTSSYMRAKKMEPF